MWRSDRSLHDILTEHKACPLERNLFFAAKSEKKRDKNHLLHTLITNGLEATSITNAAAPPHRREYVHRHPGDQPRYRCNAPGRRRRVSRTPSCAIPGRRRRVSVCPAVLFAPSHTIKRDKPITTPERGCRSQQKKTFKRASNATIEFDFEPVVITDSSRGSSPVSTAPAVPTIKKKKKQYKKMQVIISKRQSRRRPPSMTIRRLPRRTKMTRI